jgi:Zn-dependent peptidase ImmA (M78 family)
VSRSDDCVAIAEAIQRVHTLADLPWPPPARRIVEPVPLHRLLTACRLAHEEVAGLNRAAAGVRLERWGVQRPDWREEDASLIGLLFARANDGTILVNADEPLTRRRFTAAHALGHYLLHFQPRLQATEDGETFAIHADIGDSVREEDKPASDKAKPLPEMERQANRFAIELLMPEAVCRLACEQYAARFTVSPRFLEHHLAGDLLVDREAIRRRLRSLSL